MTALKLIKRALRLLQVIDPEENPTSTQAENAVEALNAMIARWQRDGIGVSWSAVANSAEVVTLQAEAEDAVVYGLAVNLAPEYGVLPSAVVASRAREHYRDILRDSSGVAHADLASLPETSGYFDIQNG